MKPKATPKISNLPELAEFLSKHLLFVSHRTIYHLLEDYQNLPNHSEEIKRITGDQGFNGDIPLKEANKNKREKQGR